MGFVSVLGLALGLGLGMGVGPLSSYMGCYRAASGCVTLCIHSLLDISGPLRMPPSKLAFDRGRHHSPDFVQVIGSAGFDCGAFAPLLHSVILCRHCRCLPMSFTQC